VVLRRLETIGNLAPRSPLSFLAVRVESTASFDAGVPLAVIAGSDEFESGTVTVKDLRIGAEVAKGVSDRQEWLKAENVQTAVRREEMIGHIRRLLAVPSGNPPVAD